MFMLFRPILDCNNNSFACFLQGPKHEEDVTQNAKYYQCDQCEYVADRIIRLRKHRRRTHMLDEDPQYLKDQVCI